MTYLKRCQVQILLLPLILLVLSSVTIALSKWAPRTEKTVPVSTPCRESQVSLFFQNIEQKLLANFFCKENHVCREYKRESPSDAFFKKLFLGNEYNMGM